MFWSNTLRAYRLLALVAIRIHAPPTFANGHVAAEKTEE
jgi:hypothetical protein